MRGERKYLSCIESCGGRHDVQSALQHVWQMVEATAVRERRGMQHDVARTNGTHACEIAMAHPTQLARAEYDALGAACGPGRVEQPGRIGLAPLDKRCAGTIALR